MNTNRMNLLIWLIKRVNNEVTGNAFSQKLKGSGNVTFEYLTVDVKKKKQLQKVIISICSSGLFIITGKHMFTSWEK